MQATESWRTCAPMRVKLDGGRSAQLPAGQEVVALHRVYGVVLIRRRDCREGMGVSEAELCRCAQRLRAA